jgi:hypothetical protein
MYMLFCALLLVIALIGGCFMAATGPKVGGSLNAFTDTVMAQACLLLSLWTSLWQA